MTEIEELLTPKCWTMKTDQNKTIYIDFVDTIEKTVCYRVDDKYGVFMEKKTIGGKCTIEEFKENFKPIEEVKIKEGPGAQKISRDWR